MNLSSIIFEIDANIERLQKAKALLAENTPKRKPGSPRKSALSAVPKKKRNLWPEGRARITAAVKTRWAKQKKAA